MKFNTYNINFSWRDKEKRIILPEEMSEELAEDIGIHLGDGSAGIYCNKKQIDYHYKCSGHVIDDKEWYDNFVIPLKKNLYNLDLRGQYFPDHTYGIRFRSKAVVLYLRDILGIKIGNKTKTVDFPEVISESSLTLKTACLRGLFDTDFSVSFKKKKEDYDYPVISAGFASPNIVRSICYVLDDIGFNYSKFSHTQMDTRTAKFSYKWFVSVSGKKNLEKWFNNIGSHNPKHVSKFDVWKKFGHCPPKTNLTERLEFLSGGKHSREFKSGPHEI